MFTKKSLISHFPAVAILIAFGWTTDLQAGDDAIVLRSRVFDIPFQMDATSTASRIQLFVSTDQGQTWKIAGDEPIWETQFHFQAAEDGEYWFATETDLNGTEKPPRQRTPQRKIIVDTIGPAIELSGGGSLDGKVTANLILADTQKVATLRILYATDVVREWKTIPNTSIDAKGDFSFKPAEDWRQISVHVTATDSLGNASVEAKTFRRPRVAAQPGRRFAHADQSPSSIDRLDPLPGPHDPFGSTKLPNENQVERSVDAQTTNRLRVQPAAGPADPPSFFPQVLTQATPNVAPSSQPSPTFGSAFKSFEKQTLTAKPPTSQNASGQSLSLPATGLTAQTTPQGVEVLATPQGEIENAPDSNSESNVQGSPNNFDNIFPSIQSGSANAPSAKAPSAKPSVPSTTNASEPQKDQAKTPALTGPRNVKEAMRPIEPEVNPPAKAVVETIPTPAPSETPQDRKRYRAERAEEENRKQQELFDRAQLASSVPIRHSESNRFSLEYELEAIGNTGAEAIELYGSLDAGQTWKRWGEDPDRESPFDIETKGEGLFAFRIVVVGNNGLASPRPLPGDVPDIAVLVDQTQPKIRITSARYGEGDRVGALVIRYECSDEHLMRRPVRVAFSDSIEGPWTTIAAGLRNDGLYVWPADPKLPRMIYLRLDATDQAGNVGTYILDEPIETQGLAPRARILGFRSH